MTDSCGCGCGHDHDHDHDDFDEMNDVEFSISTIDADGNVVNLDVMFMLDAGDKTFVIYTDGTTNEFGSLSTYAGQLIEEIVDGEVVSAELIPVESDDDWDLIESAIDQVAYDEEDEEYFEE